MANPPQMELYANINAPRTEVTIELRMEGKALGHILLEAPELEQFIHQLAGHRERLADEVAREVDPGTRLTAQLDPVWQVPAQRVNGCRLLLLRHPGLGWLSFALPDKEAESIAAFLTQDLPA